MKGARWLVRFVRGVLLLVWLAVLTSMGAWLLLLFAGVLIPTVTVRTVLDSWWWTAAILGLLVYWGVTAGRRYTRIFERSAVPLYSWASIFLVSLIVLFYTVERWRGHQAWKRLETDLPGERFDLTALQPAPVAVAQNFSQLPVIQQWWGDELITVERSPLKRLVEGVPEAGAWEWQKPADLTACLKFYFPGQGRTGEDVTPEGFLAAWEEFAPELDQLRAGALRTHARFELPYDRGLYDTTLYGRLELFEAIAQAFRLKAVAALRDGKSAVALSEVEQLFKISDLVGQEPLMERQRLMLLMAAVQPIWEGIVGSQWSEAQLTVLQQWLERPSLLHEYGRAVRKDCLLLVDMCEKLLPARSPAPPMPVTEEVVPRWLLMGLRWVYPTGWSLQNQVGIIRLGRLWREDSAKPESHRFYVDATRGIERMWVIQPPSLDPLFAVFVMPRAGHIGQDVGFRYAFAQTALDLAATGCAIERFKLARRQLPERLDLLVPTWKANVPLDLMNGRALRYHRLDRGGYLVYSVGWDQNDDGGRVRQDDEATAWGEWPRRRTEGDWVWANTPSSTQPKRRRRQSHCRRTP